MEFFAHSSSGELYSSSAATCVLILLVLDDNSVIMEHRSDIDLGGVGSEEEAMALFHSITQNIIKCKETDCSVRAAFIVGGSDESIKQEFEKSLQNVRKEIMDDESFMELDGGIQVSLANNIKLLDLTWNIKEEEELFQKNTAFIQLGIIHHHEAGHCLVLKQCINLVNSETDDRTTLCCGVLSFILNFASDMCSNSPFNYGEFYIRKELAELYEAEKDIVIINKTVERFIMKAIGLGAKQLDVVDGSLTVKLEESLINRLTNQIPPGVSVYRL
ncbi:unnamed protein product [Rotaria sordida]|uniref:Uncharacterized protein n=1 Tax=Rotaria sordida TaxID=392033 RepID=A0A815H3P5_9BILA|nr:unnamed protein product [Rotaria sordida]CAF1600642.1 unnamed protein product [Rotaria sordida]